MIDKKVLVVGHLSLDKIKTSVSEANNIPGGAALYTSVAAGVYGNQVGLLSTFCEDFPRTIFETLKTNSVDSFNVIQILGQQRRSFMEYSESFERTTHSHARKLWYQCTIDQTPHHTPLNGENYSAIILSPMIPDSQIQYSKWAKERGMLVCADTSEYFAEHQPEKLIELLKYVDIFLPSEVELEFMYPQCKGNLDGYIEVLSTSGISIAVIKCANKGARIADFKEDVTIGIGIRETKVCDATGAGDSFNGGFISCYCDTNDIVKSGRYAAALASVCIEKLSFDALVKTTKEDILLLSKSVPVHVLKGEVVKNDESE